MSRHLVCITSLVLAISASTAAAHMGEYRCSGGGVTMVVQFTSGLCRIDRKRAETIETIPNKVCRNPNTGQTISIQGTSTQFTLTDANGTEVASGSCSRR